MLGFYAGGYISVCLQMKKKPTKSKKKNKTMFSIYLWCDIGEKLLSAGIKWSWNHRDFMPIYSDWFNIELLWHKRGWSLPFFCLVFYIPVKMQQWKIPLYLQEKKIGRHSVK